MNSPDNINKEKESAEDPAKTEKMDTNEIKTKRPEVRSRYDTDYGQAVVTNHFAHRRQTISLDRPSSSNKLTTFHLPKHLGRPKATYPHLMLKKYSADELDIKDTLQRRVADQKSAAIMRFHQRLAQTIQSQVQEKQLQVVETEALQVVNIDNNQEIANEIMSDTIKSQEEDEMIIKQAYDGSREQQQLLSTDHVNSDLQHQYIEMKNQNSSESFLIPMTPKQKTELQFNTWLMQSRRQTVCEPGPSSLNSSVFSNLPRYGEFKASHKKSQPTNHNADKLGSYSPFCEDVNVVQIIDTQDGHVEPAYVLQQDAANDNSLQNEYVDYEFVNNGKHSNHKERKSEKRCNATRSSIDNHSSRKKRYNSKYRTPQSPDERDSISSYKDNIRSRSHSRDRIRYISRSPTPKRCHTPARPRTPASPEPNKSGDYIRLLIYDQDMVSGGIFSAQERKIVRAFNTALAAAMTQDSTGIYNGFQLYDAEFKFNFFTFAVNDKKYISPLRKIVDGLPELWENCKLGLMQRGKSLNFVAVVCEIPMNGGSINFHDFLNILQMQNTDIDFNTWGLYKQIDTSKKIYMILRVEASIWKLLKERIIYFLSSTLQFRLRGQIAGFETDEGIQRVYEDSSLLNDFQDENSSDEEDAEYEEEEVFDYNDEEEMEEVKDKKRKNNL